MALNRIWKFEIKLLDRQTVKLPSEFSILSAGMDPDGILCIWAAVNPESLARKIEIIVVGTGHPLPHVGDFIATVKDGPYMWHIFTSAADSANMPANGAFHYLTKGNS